MVKDKNKLNSLHDVKKNNGQSQCSVPYQEGALLLLFEIDPQCYSSIYTYTIYTPKYM